MIDSEIQSHALADTGQAWGPSHFPLASISDS